MLFGHKKSDPQHDSGQGAGATGRARPALFQTGPSISQSGGFGRPGSVIRMPMGVMGVAIVLFVVLIVVAYEVGYARGRKDTVVVAAPSTGKPISVAHTGNVEAVPIEPGTGLPGSSNRLPGTRTAGTGRTGVVPKASEAPTTERTDPQTGRQVGLNYCIVATYGKDDAERLSDFMKSKGVDTVVVSTHNRKLFQVVDLKGFTAEEYHGMVFEEHRKRLRQIGREWKEKQHGPDDLKDIWVEKFTGGPTSRPD